MQNPEENTVQNDSAILHNLAVYRSFVNHENRRFTTTFFGHDEKSVWILARRALDDAEKYSFPSLSPQTEKLGRINDGPEALIYYVMLTKHSLE